ncbi:MAG: sigma-54 dependent transcriptional regulator [Pirellulaceae bacterium]
MVGGSKPMEDVRHLINKVAPTMSTVLIRGETGTGKELAARAVHDYSLRADRPFVAVNCGALPESLIESELFGHRKGAFTGADEQRIGLFEAADSGTLFLDEIGELPKSMQAKLLRVLESGEIRRLGDNESFQIDVRVICATHRNLADMVDQGDFREDLMYRINTFEVYLPPLRDRIADIPELATHLCERFRGRACTVDQAFTPEALEALCRHTWPGNVRELANVVEHATILCDQLPIDRQHLPRDFDNRQVAATRAGLAPMSLKELEQIAIDAALDRHEGNKVAAAEELGISLKTLYNKLAQPTGSQKTA